jgi:hypothetical protein
MRTHIQRAGTLLGLLIALPAAQAGSVTAGSADVTVSGGVTGGYFRTTNIGVKDVDDYAVPDFLVEPSTPSDGAVGVTAAFGHLGEPSIWEGGVPPNPPETNVDLQYGYLTVPAGSGITVDAGILATMIGYEVAPTYANANVLLGSVWYEQPVYYKGIRATWAGNGLNVFVEANDDPAVGGKSAVVGVNGSAGPVNYAVSYDNGFKSYSAGSKDILDIIVSGTLGGIDTALNLDYQKLDNQVSSLDDSAYGLALYATFPVAPMTTIPVRVEYISDGTSGLYEGVDSGYTFTVTPTYHYTENTFVRGELAYISASNDVFTKDDGSVTGTNTSFNVQAGVTF